MNYRPLPYEQDGDDAFVPVITGAGETAFRAAAHKAGNLKSDWHNHGP